MELINGQLTGVDQKLIGIAFAFKPFKQFKTFQTS